MPQKNATTQGSDAMNSEKTVAVNGLSIERSTHLLRNYVTVERRSIKILVGWFLYAPAYEMKYRLAYHVLDHADHVTAWRQRLGEMRGGRPEAAVAPALRLVMDEALDAPSTESMLRGLYGVIKRALLSAYREHLDSADPAANAVEIRLLRRIIPEIATQLEWYDGLGLENSADPWQEYIRALLQSAGGISGFGEKSPPPTPFAGKPFQRAKTIYFDDRIRIGALTPYDQRQRLEANRATVEQFKVFFNELYAAALLSSLIFDAFDDGHPWEFYADMCRHFWDEVRHSEFGATRLRELGEAPTVCNPVLYEYAESLPVLHRLCYLTRGLEAYFMPRKQPRVREYENNGDHRSQLFADQDWSDEITHVRYGSVWGEHLLQDDFRTVENIIEEVRQHMAKMTGRPDYQISAPF